MVQLEYVGPIAETFSIRSRIRHDIVYRFGNNPHHKIRPVLRDDAEYLTGMTDGDNKPLYRILTGSSLSEQQNPSEFLGEPVTA